ncbi:MAG TPA: carboxypeptidase-like regulatory domain-containing protein [Candidatus Angelobacter sp.]|nr:carboxypeptidase-like regulatory domain-containing protein [Candidatus Angelobacter sp.]
MGTYRLLLLFLAASALASAQPNATDTFKLEGTVVNSVTGRPVARTLVQFGDRAALTGPEGEFSFDHVPPASTTITVYKPGYFAPGIKTQHSPGSVPATVGPGADKTIVKLVPEAVISGRVTGRDEEPLEGVQVQVMATYAADGARQLFSQAAAQTDEDGYYRIAGLFEGRYFLQMRTLNAARRILGARSGKAEDTYPPSLYYPASTDYASAAPVTLSAGQHLEASFALTPVPAYRVAGTVISSGEWKQVNPPLIVDATGQMLMSVDRFDRGSNAFEFRKVPAGSYILRGSGRDQQDRTVFSQQNITVSQPLNGVRVVLHPGVDVPVVVRTQFNNPRPRCSATISMGGSEAKQVDCSELPAARVELISLDSIIMHYSTPATSSPDTANYGVHGVPPGKYMARAWPNFGGYVQSIRCGSQDLLREPLVIPESGSVGVIEVTLRDDSANLDVSVRSGKPLEQELVILVPDDGLFPEPQVVSQGRGAEFHYASLAPGVYKVFAFDSAAGIDYKDPKVLAQYASAAARIRIAANDNASVAVDVIRTGE